MLLRHMPDGVLAISQPAHALLAGELARSWDGDAFAVPSPQNQVIQASCLHDLGWAEWEMAPVFDPRTGFPLEYQDVPAEIHTELWSQGVRHAEAYGRWIALLISRHGDAIYEKTFDATTARPEAAEAVEAFLRQQGDIQTRLVDAITATGAGSLCGETNLDVIKAFMVAVDTLSLHVCRGIAAVTTIDDIPDRSGSRTRLTLHPTAVGIDIAPWPFARAEPLLVSVEGRLLRHPVDSQEALDKQLASSEPVTAHVTLRSLEC